MRYNYGEIIIGGGVIERIYAYDEEYDVYNEHINGIDILGTLEEHHLQDFCRILRDIGIQFVSRDNNGILFSVTQPKKDFCYWWSEFSIHLEIDFFHWFDSIKEDECIPLNTFIYNHNLHLYQDDYRWEYDTIDVLCEAFRYNKYWIEQHEYSITDYYHLYTHCYYELKYHLNQYKDKSNFQDLKHHLFKLGEQIEKRCSFKMKSCIEYNALLKDM